jgi:putative NADPH-quinone reductase
MNKRKRILLIQGHPDASKRHLGHVLEDAYGEGAIAEGHEVRRVQVASLEFPLLRSQEEWEHGELPAGLADAQASMAWADHLVLLFPLWLGDMPAILKGFLEQIARPGFAFKGDAKNPFASKALSGRSARVIVTMGMPALLYRWYFWEHSLRSLDRNILRFVGIAPVRETLIGMVGKVDAQRVQRLESQLRGLGRKAK